MTAILTAEDRYEAVRHLQDAYQQIAETDPSPAMQLAAQWAADLHVLQQLLWENYLIPAPDFRTEYASINQHLDRGWSLLATDTSDHEDVAALLTAARTTLMDAFPDLSLIHTWHERLADAGRYAGVPVPTALDWMRVRAQHAGKVPATLLLENRRNRNLEASQALRSSEDHDSTGQVARLWELDWTVFHTHLVQTAHNAGDEYMLSVELRWRVAAALLARFDSLPTQADAAATIWREAMTTAVGLQEGEQLATQFLPL